MRSDETPQKPEEIKTEDVAGEEPKDKKAVVAEMPNNDDETESESCSDDESSESSDGDGEDDGDSDGSSEEAQEVEAKGDKK